MPAYISHSIMGDQLYKEAIHDNSLFKSNVDHDSLKAYSLDIDLTGFSMNVHGLKTQEFLLRLIKYIKDNHFINDKYALAFLYGHIGHFFFDTNAHPLIYYIEKGCMKSGLFSPHTLVEGYLDSFLAANVLQEDIMNINDCFFANVDLRNPQIAKIIRTLYGEIYQKPNMLWSYKTVILCVSFLEYFIKDIIGSKQFLIRLADFEKFLELNNLSREEIVNKYQERWINPISGDVSHDSFMDLYQRAMNMTMDAIKKVNGYLYDNTSISSLEPTFPNISYDTGMDISLGFDMLYVRKRVKK